MSGAVGFLATGAGALATVLLRRPRKIATIIPDVVLEEIGLDELVITDHPVERGAPISDHAFKRPCELILRCGWSNSASTQVGGFAAPGLSRGLASVLGGNGDRVSATYAELLALQEGREPITISTGKREYENMLMQSLALTTDQETEDALMVVARFREVIIVETRTASAAPQEQQASPEQTAEPQDRGNVQSEQEANDEFMRQEIEASLAEDPNFRVQTADEYMAESVRAYGSGR